MARTIHLRSRNADFQHLEALRRNREKRHRHGEFFVEGVRAITQAVALGWSVRAFAHSSERPLSAWALDVLLRADADVHYTLPDAGMAELSERNEPSELVAVIRMPGDDVTRLEPHADADAPLLVVACDRPSSPGNLGSLLRSVDALGGHGLIVVGHAVDVYDPEVIRASTGSFFAVPVIRMAGVPELLAWREGLRGRWSDVPIVGTDEHAPAEVSATDLAGPLILALGNETHGLSRGFLAACTDTVQIPMTGTASSLNVAAAGSILLYEIGRQRRHQR
ncbi:TrmH family RNA methyltransferase [Deinococcus sp.]|uniref:TrmH family RNA methyltransferase n=1 Tax=Deinococcus sp. TaxID=47478 RepID=UPI00286982C0|nr:TrmH family RNA methyltransferase [Deinococcus sp.]